MSVSLGNNIASLRAQRRLDTASQSLASVSERLSSGLRIRKAADDAAGLSIASLTNTDARVYARAIQNLNDGISYLSIADSALSQLSDVVTRQRELAAQAINGTLSNKQRQALDKEYQVLAAEYNRVLDSSVFNGTRLFRQESAALILQAGYGATESFSAQTSDMLGRRAGSGDFVVGGTSSYGYFTNPLGTFSADVNNDGKADLLSSTGEWGWNVWRSDSWSTDSASHGCWGPQ